MHSFNCEVVIEASSSVVIIFLRISVMLLIYIAENLIHQLYYNATTAVVNPVVDGGGRRIRLPFRRAR